ncbi:MAG: Icc-like protein [Deltaproteobacteria bacterium]|nr:MAG: Icc-like protein [Desulfobacterales bacterium]PIE72197.1 MAG: Icc-like protein [Deltaproteobacteria bacterium]
MKILCVADTPAPDLLLRRAGKLPLAGIDLILSCGDLPPEYLTSLRETYDAALYYVLGNHDLRYQSAPPVGCSRLDGQLVRFQGRHLLGFSGSRWYNGGMNQYTEKEMKRQVNKMRFPLWRRKRVDLVVTHAPPRFVHDAEDLCHRGFRTYRWFIEKYRPRFFLHGHIHRDFKDDSLRRSQLHSTSIINCYGYYVLEI